MGQDFYILPQRKLKLFSVCCVYIYSETGICQSKILNSYRSFDSSSCTSAEAFLYESVERTINASLLKTDSISNIVKSYVLTIDRNEVSDNLLSISFISLVSQALPSAVTERKETSAVPGTSASTRTP